MTAADSRARAAALVVVPAWAAEAWAAALAAPDDGGSVEESDLHFIVVRLVAAAGLAAVDEAGSARLDRVDGWLQRLSAESWNDGQPTTAALALAAALGVRVNALRERRADPLPGGKFTIH